MRRRRSAARCASTTSASRARSSSDHKFRGTASRSAAHATACVITSAAYATQSRAEPYLHTIAWAKAADKSAGVIWPASCYGSGRLILFQPKKHVVFAGSMQKRAFRHRDVMKGTLSLTLVSAALMAGACGFDHSTNVLTPTSINTNPSGSSSSGGPMVGMWESNALPTLPTGSTCGNFKYTIASQTQTSIAGTFTGDCGGGITISGNATGQLSGTNVAMTVNGTGTGPGLPSCPFTLTGNGAIEDNGNTLRIPFTGTTCAGPVSGVEVLRKPQPAAPPPPPPPPPTPDPTPAPPPASVDAIDMNSISIVGSPDVRGWPATARIRALD